MSSIFTKMTTVFTLVCFTITSGGSAFADSAASQQEIASIVKAAESLIPFSAGKVAYVKNFGSKDVVINIQDLHCHGETQKNIAAILSSLEKYGYDKIYLEGAVEDVSTSGLADLGKNDTGALVIEDMLADGTLTGAEYYSVKSGRPDIIKALDKDSLYFENIILLDSLYEKQPEILPALNGFSADLESVKKEYYNSDLLRLNKAVTDFAAGKISAKKYYAILNKLSKKASININAYTSVEKYINLINEKGIDYQRVTEELQVYISVLKNILPYGVYGELAKKSGDFSQINDLMPVFAGLSEKYDICKRHKLKQLDAFFGYITNNNELNPLDYVSEEDRLLYDIGLSLSQNRYEREVVFLDRFSKAMKGFYTAKISAADYDYYVKNRKTFYRLSSLYLDQENPHLKYLAANSAVFEKYHANNLKRDNVFLKTLSCSHAEGADKSSGDFSGLQELISSVENGANVKVVITGGFHSEGLKKRLEEEKISLVIITPNVTGQLSKAEEAYSSAISEYARIFTSAIAVMPYSGQPIQKAVPDMVAKVIARANGSMSVQQQEELINSVFAESSSKNSFSETGSVYEPVHSAEVKILSVNERSAEFTVTYRYGAGYSAGFHCARYVYDFETGRTYLTVDNKSVETLYESFFYHGKEGYSMPSLIVQYGETARAALTPLMKELGEQISSETLLLMDPYYCHSTVAAYARSVEDSGSKIKKALTEPLDAQYLHEVKESLGDALEGIKPFKAPLTGHFKLMQDGVIIYQIDNPAILANIDAVRSRINGEGWTKPLIVHITIGRLLPGKYTQKDLDKIGEILAKYNESNPLAASEFLFEDFTYGQFIATGNRNISTETIRFAPAQSDNGPLAAAIAEELSGFENSTRFNIPEDEYGKFFEADGIDDILDAMELIAASGLDRYEITFDSLVPDNYTEKDEKELKNFKRKMVSSGELYEGVKNIRDYLIANADAVREKASEHGISLSIHALSMVCIAAGADGVETAVNPSPAFNRQMRDIFYWHLDIAQAIGADSLTVHIEDYGIESYIEFVKEAARRNITVNFENHLRHSPRKMKNPDSFYYHTLLQGFMPKEKFIETMLAVKAGLTEEEQRYLGVTFDTSKALNSYLKTLPEGADEQEIKRELAKVSLENLIDYYEAIVAAGLNINNMHIAQFSAEVSDVRPRVSEEAGEKGLSAYNKSNLEAANNPNLDMVGFLKFLKKKKYKGALQQETPGLLPPASILNEKFKGNAVYKHLIAPFWEEGLFRLLPFSAAMIFSFSPAGVIITAAASLISFAFAHIIADWVIKKERPKITLNSLKAFIPGAAFTGVYFAVSSFFPAVILGQLAAFAASFVSHVIYSFFDNEEKRNKRIRQHILNVGAMPPVPKAEALKPLTALIRAGGFKKIIEAAFARIDGMPEGVIRGLTDSEAAFLYIADEELAAAMGINPEAGAKGFGYAAFAERNGKFFDNAGGLDHLLRKYAGDAGITAFTGEQKTSIHNITRDGSETVFLVERRDKNGFITDFYPAFDDGMKDAVQITDVINGLASRGSFAVYVNSGRVIVDLYDNFGSSMYIEYAPDKKGGYSAEAFVSTRGVKEEKLKGFKKVFGKYAAQSLERVTAGGISRRAGLESVKTDGLDSRIAELRKMGAREMREKLEEGMSILHETLIKGKHYSYVSDSVRSETGYAVRDLITESRQGLRSLGSHYEKTALNNFLSISELALEHKIVYSDLMLYAIMLKGVKDVRAVYNTLERLRYSLPMLSPFQFLALIEKADLENLNHSFPFVLENLTGGEYAFSSSKMALFLNNVSDFLNMPKKDIYGFFNKIDREKFERSFRYLTLHSLNERTATAEDKERFGSDTYLQEMFSRFYAGRHSIKDAVAAGNPSFHNLNDYRAVQKAYNEVLSAVKDRNRPFELFKKMVCDDLGYPLANVEDGDFKIFADEIAQGLYQYVTEAEKRYGKELVEKLYSAIGKIRYFKGKGVEFKLLGRTFKEINSGDEAGDCTAPGQVSFGSFLTNWFPSPDFQSLNVYIDGRFILKFNLVISEDKEGRRILVIDAMETSPVIRIEPKTVEGENEFDEKMKDPEESFSSVNFSRDAALAQAFEFIAALAKKQKAKSVYMCDITNSKWLSSSMKKISKDAPGLKEFKDMEKYQSANAGRGLSGVDFGKVSAIKENAQRHAGEYAELEKLYNLLAAEMKAKNPDALQITALMREYLNLVSNEFYVSSRKFDSDFLTFLTKNRFYNMLAELALGNKEMLIRLDYSQVDQEVRRDIVAAISDIDRTASEVFPKRDFLSQGFFTALLFESDSFLEEGAYSVASDSMYDRIVVWGKGVAFHHTAKYFLNNDNALNVFLSHLTDRSISEEQFRKLVLAAVLSYFLPRGGMKKRIESGKLFDIVQNAAYIGIVPGYMLPGREEFLQLEEGERNALAYSYMFYVIDALKLTDDKAKKKMMMNFRGVIHADTASFDSLNAKGLIKFDHREHYIKEVTLLSEDGGNYDIFSSYDDNNLSLANRAAGAAVSSVAVLFSVSALALSAFPVAAAVFSVLSFAALLNYLLQYSIIRKAAEKAGVKGGVIVARTDGQNISIEKGVFDNLPFWYRDMVLSHELTHIKLNFITNRVLNEIVTTFADLAAFPFYYLRGKLIPEKPEFMEYVNEQLMLEGRSMSAVRDSFRASAAKIKFANNADGSVTASFKGRKAEIYPGDKKEEIFLKIKGLLRERENRSIKNDVHFHTSFYKEEVRAHIFDVLYDRNAKKGLLADMIKEKQRKGYRKLRVWSCGSASGDELRTLVWLTRQALEDAGEKPEDWRLDFVGTDIDSIMLEKAANHKEADVPEFSTEEVFVNTESFNIKYYSLNHTNKTELDNWIEMQNSEGGLDLVVQLNTPSSKAVLETIFTALEDTALYAHHNRLHRFEGNKEIDVLSGKVTETYSPQPSFSYSVASKYGISDAGITGKGNFFASVSSKKGGAVKKLVYEGSVNPELSINEKYLDGLEKRYTPSGIAERKHFRKVLSSIRKLVKRYGIIKVVVTDKVYVEGEDYDMLPETASLISGDLIGTLDGNFIVLRKDIAGNDIAVVSALLSLALIKGELNVSSVIQTLTDPDIKKRHFLDKLNADNDLSVDLNDKKTVHYAMRAFQRQYFGNYDKELTAAIKYFKAFPNVQALKEHYRNSQRAGVYEVPKITAQAYESDFLNKYTGKLRAYLNALPEGVKVYSGNEITVADLAGFEDMPLLNAAVDMNGFSANAAAFEKYLGVTDTAISASGEFYITPYGEILYVMNRSGFDEKFASVSEELEGRWDFSQAPYIKIAQLTGELDEKKAVELLKFLKALNSEIENVPPDETMITPVKFSAVQRYYAGERPAASQRHYYSFFNRNLYGFETVIAGTDIISLKSVAGTLLMNAGDSISILPFEGELYVLTSNHEMERLIRKLCAQDPSLRASSLYSRVFTGITLHDDFKIDISGYKSRNPLPEKTAGFAARGDSDGFIRLVPIEKADVLSASGTAGFIGHFQSILIDGINEKRNKAVLEGLVTNSGDDSLHSVTIEGRFKAMPDADAIIKRMIKQSDNPSFVKVLNLLRRFVKANPGIKYFEFDKAYIPLPEGAGTESIMDELGGFAVDKPLNDKFPVQDRIVAVRADLAGNELAFVHELLHLAVAAYKIKIADIQDAVTDEQIREKFFAEGKEEKLRWQKEWRDTDKKDFRASFHAIAFDIHSGERAHYVIRAFQAQYFAREDEALTRFIRAVLHKDRKAKIAGIAKRQAADLRFFTRLTDSLVSRINGLYAGREETAEEQPESIMPEIEMLKGVEGKSFTGLAEYLNIDNKKKMKLGKETVRIMDIKEGDEIIFFALTDDRALMFKNPEQLSAIKTALEKSAPGLDRRRLQHIMLFRTYYAKVLPGMKVDVSGVLGRLQIPDESVAGFFVTGRPTEIADIRHMGKEAGKLSLEHERTPAEFKTYVRMFGDILLFAKYFYQLDEDYFYIASLIAKFEKDRELFIEPLKDILESAVYYEDLNGEQKAFALFLLRVIADIDGVSDEAFRETLVKAGGFKIKSFMIWLNRYYDSAKNKEEILKTVKYYETVSAVKGAPAESLKTAASAMAKLGEIISSGNASQNERFLLEAERELAPGERHLYGRYAVNIATGEKIEFEKMAALKEFGVRPVIMTTGGTGAFLCNAEVTVNGKTGTVKARIKLFEGVPVISVSPVNSFEISADEEAEFLKKASVAVLKKISGDFVVKGRFAVLSNNVSLFQKVIYFFSSESLLRKLGSVFDFDLGAAFFDGTKFESIRAELEESFPAAAPFDSSDAEENTASADSAYYDADSSAAKVRSSVLNILKRIVLSKKRSETRSGSVIGESVNAELFCGMAARRSPLSAGGINAFSQYFEKRMSYGHSPVAVLENFAERGSHYTGNAALIDWAAEDIARQMFSSGLLDKNELNFENMNINEIRERSLEIAEKALSVADASLLNAFEAFVNSNPELSGMPRRAQFAQFILSGQLKSNVEAIQNRSGRAVLSIDVDHGSVKALVDAVLFWQKAGFDGVRLNFSEDSAWMLGSPSFMSSVNSALRAKNPDFMIITALPGSMQKDAVKTAEYVKKASERDIVSAVGVEALSEGLKEYQLKIWADINPMDEKYRAEPEKYFEDISKAVEFGAGYLGLAAGSSLLSADGAGTHIEVIDRIKELLSSSKTKISAHQAYRDSYRLGITQAKEIKAGTETLKALVAELIKLQDGKPLREGAAVEEMLKNGFRLFVEGESSLSKNSFVRRALDINDEFDVYRLAGFLRGVAEEKALDSYKKKNSGSEFDAATSEILRGLLFMDMSVDQQAAKMPEDELIKMLTESLGVSANASPDEIYRMLIERTYGGEHALSICDYAAYMYILRSSGGATMAKISEDMSALMKAYLSESSSGFGSPVDTSFNSPLAYRAKTAITDILEGFASVSAKPQISKAVKVSVNTAEISMMLKAA